ncbi:MAG: EAL domain-containing protein [Oscillatoriales cyanobacterium C42_A2020_001]|nr:EAL domain-containing protein [Leptolyngbyaceae cyanobacterium C42_A2020_001]
MRLLHTGHLGVLTEEGQRLLNIAIHNTNRLTCLAEAIEHEPAISVSIISELEIEQLQLENDFYAAFDHQELELFYQPIVATQENQIIGFEALARWHHPSKGWISPTTFIPLAEKTGLIHQLGLWSLNQACHQLHSWQQQFPTHPPLTMSVNLSTLQLLQPDLTQQILHVIQTTNIAPHSLKLEITESSLIQNHEAAIAMLSDLRALGIQFYVDDFGTGYSSLGRLKDLPIDALKIDRSFVNGKKWDISETILMLATKLGLSVIAEGVETLEELASLKALGCNYMQGYLFSKPVDHHAVSDLLASGLQI